MADRDVFDEMREERERQQAEENWSLDHDDAHTVNDWMALLVRYGGLAIQAAEASNPTLYRRRMIQIGAIMGAAEQSLTRALSR